MISTKKYLNVLFQQEKWLLNVLFIEIILYFQIKAYVATLIKKVSTIFDMTEEHLVPLRKL
jgi:hypothetical protein